MYDLIKKLLDSKPTVILILLVMVLAWAYTIDNIKKPVTQAAPTVGKTLEEIMSGPVDSSVETAWDKDFKSAVEAIE